MTAAALSRVRRWTRWVNVTDMEAAPAPKRVARFGEASRLTGHAWARRPRYAGKHGQYAHATRRNVVGGCSYPKRPISRGRIGLAGRTLQPAHGTLEPVFWLRTVGSIGIANPDRSARLPVPINRGTVAFARRPHMSITAARPRRILTAFPTSSHR